MTTTMDTWANEKWSVQILITFIISFFKIYHCQISEYPKSKLNVFFISNLINLKELKGTWKGLRKWHHSALIFKNVQDILEYDSQIVLKEKHVKNSKKKKKGMWWRWYIPEMTQYLWDICYIIPSLL